MLAWRWWKVCQGGRKSAKPCVLLEGWAIYDLLDDVTGAAFVAERHPWAHFFGSRFFCLVREVLVECHGRWNLGGFQPKA